MDNLNKQEILAVLRICEWASEYPRTYDMICPVCGEWQYDREGNPMPHKGYCRLARVIEEL